MDFLKKLDLLMEEQKLNKHSLSEKCGIPYTTIDGWYKKGYERIKVSTLIKLADFFDVELDYLVRPSITDRFFGRESQLLTAIEKELLTQFRFLNETGKQLLLENAKAFANSPTTRKDTAEKTAI